MATKTDTSEWLGVGVYTPSEAAFYARLRPQTMLRWMYGGKSTGAVIDPQLGTDAKVLTFLDFVQALAVRAIRTKYGIPLAKIREAVERAKQKYGVEYPLARRHVTYLFERCEPTARKRSAGDRPASSELVIRLAGDRLVQMSGEHRDNLLIREIAEVYMKSVHYGELGLAEEYEAWKGGGLAITMNPKRHFGEPALPSGYSAQALCDAVQSEGGIDHAASAYGVPRLEVELAVEYFDHLQAPA